MGHLCSKVTIGQFELSGSLQYLKYVRQPSPLSDDVELLESEKAASPIYPASIEPRAGTPASLDDTKPLNDVTESYGESFIRNQTMLSPRTMM